MNFLAVSLRTLCCFVILATEWSLVSAQGELQTDQLQQMNDAVEETLNKMVLSQLKDITLNLEKAFTACETKVNNTIDECKKCPTPPSSEGPSGLDAVLGSVLGAARSKLNKPLSKVEGGSKTAFNEIKKLTNKAGSGLKNIGNKIKSGGAKPINEIKKFFTNIPTPKAMLKGMEKGLKDVGQKIYNGLGKAFEKTGDFFKKTFKFRRALALEMMRQRRGCTACDLVDDNVKTHEQIMEDVCGTAYLNELARQNTLARFNYDLAKAIEKDNVLVKFQYGSNMKFVNGQPQFKPVTLTVKIFGKTVKINSTGAYIFNDHKIAELFALEIFKRFENDWQ